MSFQLWAQDLGITISQVVTLDSELVFGSTSVGQRITTSLEGKVAALAAENIRISAELEAEELQLTELRKTIDPAEFRELAREFDEKVQRIRKEQDAKQRELQQLREAERQSFVDAITPILSSVAREHGALVVLERRNVVLSADSIDITQEVIDRIDAAFAAISPDSQVKSPTVLTPDKSTDSSE
ncbi:MAG: OmpH family outer membrane protein [Paracoccaceae bacterium]